MRIFLLLVCAAWLVGAGCSQKTDLGTEPGTDPNAGSADAGAVEPDQPDPPGQPGSKAPAPKGELTDGLRQGVWTFFHDNGQKAAEGGYDKGFKQGKWTFWYDNGNKTAEGEFVAGRKNGVWIEYDEQGQGVGQQTYENGQEVYK